MIWFEFPYQKLEFEKGVLFLRMVQWLIITICHHQFGKICVNSFSKHITHGQSQTNPRAAALFPHGPGLPLLALVGKFTLGTRNAGKHARDQGPSSVTWLSRKVWWGYVKKAPGILYLNPPGIQSLIWFCSILSDSSDRTCGHMCFLVLFCDVRVEGHMNMYDEACYSVQYNLL